MNNSFSLRSIVAVCFVLVSLFLFLIHPETNQVFVQQAAGMFLMAGILLFAWNKAMQKKNLAAILVLLGIAVLYSIPAYRMYPLFVLPVAILLLFAWAILRIGGRSNLAALFGACIFACSTWLPLYFITGGVNQGILPLRDALIDPNQISVSHGSGGYVGVPGAVFAIVGLLIVLGMIIRKRLTPVQLEVLVAAVLAVSMYMAFIESPLTNPKAIIVVVACIAWFASLAFDKMQRFLGMRDMFNQTLMVLLFCVALLDLLHITAQTFAYGLGI